MYLLLKKKWCSSKSCSFSPTWLDNSLINGMANLEVTSRVKKKTWSPSNPFKRPYLLGGVELEVWGVGLDSHESQDEGWDQRVGQRCIDLLPRHEYLTLSPILMVQWKMTLNERKLILETSHFPLNHDYGRKGIKPKKIGSGINSSHGSKTSGDPIDGLYQLF